MLSLAVAFLLCLSLVVVLSGKHPGRADVLLEYVDIPSPVKTGSLNSLSLFISFQYAKLKKKETLVINVTLRPNDKFLRVRIP